MRTRPPKLTEAQVKQLRQRRAKGEPLKSLATDFKVSMSMISRISLGLSYKAHNGT